MSALFDKCRPKWAKVEEGLFVSGGIKNEAHETLQYEAQKEQVDRASIAIWLIGIATGVILVWAIHLVGKGLP